MKKTICGASLATIMFLLAGCASPMPVGLLFTDVKLPVASAENAPVSSPKVGVAECQTFLGLIASGDASIAAAKRNGNITKIHYVDWQANNILGLFGKYQCTVYGE